VAAAEDVGDRGGGFVLASLSISPKKVWLGLNIFL